MKKRTLTPQPVTLRPVTLRLKPRATIELPTCVGEVVGRGGSSFRVDRGTQSTARIGQVARDSIRVTPTAKQALRLKPRATIELPTCVGEVVGRGGSSFRVDRGTQSTARIGQVARDSIRVTPPTRAATTTPSAKADSSKVARHFSGRATDGFTLLEVLIATAILALGLSTIFGSSILASRGTAHARMVTQAGLLASCRMTEVEAYLRMNGLPEGDNERIDDPPEMSGERCCEGPFTCDARVEKIELPQPADVQNRAGDQLLNAASGAVAGSSALGGDGGAPGAISQLAGAFGALGSGGGGAGIAGALGGSSLSGSGAPDMGGMAAQLLTGLYPTLKPLLEGAIRKVTVTVRWAEGSRNFSFDVVQYITNPGQTMQSGDTMNMLERALGGGNGTTPPGSTPPPTTPTPPR